MAMTKHMSKKKGCNQCLSKMYTAEAESHLKHSQPTASKDLKLLLFSELQVHMSPQKN